MYKRQGILTEASDEARTGTIHTIAAAVLLDGDGKLADVMLDELEVEVTADGKGEMCIRERFWHRLWSPRA